eukprot:2119947-Pleurochrysis_carterae.AAC.3
MPLVAPAPVMRATTAPRRLPSAVVARVPRVRRCRFSVLELRRVRLRCVRAQRGRAGASCHPAAVAPARCPTGGPSAVTCSAAVGRHTKSAPTAGTLRSASGRAGGGRACYSCGGSRSSSWGSNFDSTGSSSWSLRRRRHRRNKGSRRCRRGRWSGRSG